MLTYNSFVKDVGNAPYTTKLVLQRILSLHSPTSASYPERLKPSAALHPRHLSNSTSELDTPHSHPPCQRDCRGGAAVAAGTLVVAVLYLSASDLLTDGAGSKGNSIPTRKALSTTTGDTDIKSAADAGDRGKTDGSARGGAAKKFGRISVKKTGSRATKAEVDALLSKIGEHLTPWKESGISLQMVEKAYCTEELGESMRFQIVNGSYYVVGPTANFQARARNVQHQIMELHRRFSLPDVDFLLITSDRCKTVDGPHRSHDGNLTRCERLITAPEMSFGGWPEAYLLDWQTTSAWLQTAADARPWEGRKKKVFWSGGDTNEQRKIMVESEAVRDSELTDVRMMSWGDSPDAFRENFKSLAEHCDYRALLHLSGIGYSARLKFLMTCGSPVIWPNKGYWEYQEFWYHLLKDKENIIFTEEVSWDNQGRPVLDAMTQLHQNESWARAVGEAGRHLVSEVLHPDNVFLYWAELISQYSAMQTFKPTVHPDAVPLEVALLRPERTFTIGERTCSVC